MEPPKKRILIIDDDATFRKLLNIKLSAEGYAVSEASEGNEGLRLYQRDLHDLVITDIIMPEKDGIETIKALKKGSGDVKIIAISGGGKILPDEYRPAAKILGAAHTFSKPIQWPEFLSAVKGLLV